MLLPDGAWIDPLGLLNLSDNRELLNVIHRWLAVVLTAVGLYVALRRRSTGLPEHIRRAAMVFGWVLALQVGLGILTAMTHIPTALGAAHQLLAFALLSVTVWLTHAHTRTPKSSVLHNPTPCARNKTVSWTDIRR